MPYLIISGYDSEKVIKEISVDINIQFKHDYFHSPKMRIKMDEIRTKFENLVAEYFPDFESETYTNHEYNEIKSNH